MLPGEGTKKLERGIRAMGRKIPIGVFVLAAGLFAQGERGALNGTVSDPSGAVVVSARVTAVNVETGVEYPVTTTDAGVFRISLLPPGTYRLNVSAPGFKNAVRE